MLDPKLSKADLEGTDKTIIDLSVKY